MAKRAACQREAREKEFEIHAASQLRKDLREALTLPAHRPTRGTAFRPPH
jgi:hypothetical protein